MNAQSLKTLASTSYVYNRINHFEQRQSERGQFSYDYDELSRLLDSRVTGAINNSESFDYDGVGNRTSYQHNANPLQQIRDDSTPLIDHTYDTNGHQIKKTTGGVDTEFRTPDTFYDTRYFL